MKMFFIKLFDKLSNLLFPEKIKCIFCGKDVPNFEEKPYCDECEGNLPFNDGNRCKICDVEILENGEVCDLCKHNHKAFDKTRAIFKYEGSVRNVILKFKNDNAKYLAYPIAKLMTSSLTKDMKNIDMIIPVPSSKETLKKRGYNHSLLLANEIGKLLNKPVRNDCLLKIKNTKPQKSLSFKDRKENLAGAFKVVNRKDLKDKKILLIDDVMTTATTVNCCSDLLKRHAKKIYVLVFARNTTKIEKNQKNLKKHLP